MTVISEMIPKINNDHSNVYNNGHSELGSESFWGTVLTDSVSSPE